MIVYTVIQEFATPILGIRLYVGDTIGKIENRNNLLIGGIEYTNQAFSDWIGSVNSVPFLVYMATVPDPILPGVPNIKGGSQAITSGESSVTITGQDWGFIPTQISVVVTKPVGGDNLFATIRANTITADGFIVDLQAPTSGAGYTLYFIVGE